MRNSVIGIGVLLMLLSSVVRAELRDPGEHFFESTFGDYSE